MKNHQDAYENNGIKASERFLSVKYKVHKPSHLIKNPMILLKILSHFKMLKFKRIAFLYKLLAS